MEFLRTSDRSVRRRAGMALACIVVVLLGAAVQVMHHCTSVELNPGNEAGGAPVYCAICMTVQVATPAVAALLFAIGRLAPLEAAPGPEFVPHLAACFALSVRPPPIQ